MLLQLEVWAKERELAGMRASVNTINSEVQRLQKMCEERQDAEESLQEKWKKIEEFDARRLELEAIYTALLRANMVLFLQITPEYMTLAFMLPLALEVIFYKYLKKVISKVICKERLVFLTPFYAPCHRH